MRETLDLAAAHCRFAATEEEGVIEGYGAIFDDLIPSYGERVARGAFKASLAEHKAAGTRPPMLWAHGSDVVGVWEAVVEDATGLKVRGRIIRETARGAETFALLKAGALNGLSIGFATRKADFDKNGVRILRDLDLMEISIVAIPASPKARISNVRSDGTARTLELVRALKAASHSLNQVT